MNISDYILHRLAEENVKYIGLVYGGAVSELVDAFTRQKNITYIATMGEQTAGFVAEGYAKTTGSLGVTMATSGPGGMNLVTPIGNCWYDSTPVLFITGQVNTKFMRPDPSIRQLGFQETDIVSIVTPITKYAVTVKDPNMIQYELDKAIYLCKEGRPGPCLLDIPTDIQKQEYKPDVSPVFWPALRVSSPIDDVIDDFLSDLSKAKRPVLLIGGGCRNHKEDFYALAERFGIPAFPTWNALDIVTSDLPAYGGRIGTYGGAGRNFAIQNSDLLLSIGSRISGRITGGLPHTFAPKAKKYYVDVDLALLKTEFQAVPADVNIHCDAGVFMRQLTEKLQRNAVPTFDSWNAQVQDWKNKYDPVKPEHLETFHHYGFMRKLSEAMPSNAIITADTGGNVITFAHAFQTKRGQTYFTSNGNTPMAFSLGGAIGAWCADPSRPIVCLIGDGGLQFTIGDLQTVKHYNIPLKIFVFNNNCLGNTRAFQIQNGKQTLACGPDGYSAPDFVKVARAYGLDAYRCETLSDYTAIPHLLSGNKPIVVDILHDMFCDYQPRMTYWDRGIECMYPDLSEDEFNENMKVGK